jgi:hypothetical protein
MYDLRPVEGITQCPKKFSVSFVSREGEVVRREE